MTKIKIDYDISGINQVTVTPSVGYLIIFQKQHAKVQTSYKCNITEAGDHGWLLIMCLDGQWRLKPNITATVVPLADPGIFTGTTNVLKFRCKQEFKLYNEHEEHKHNSIKAIQNPRGEKEN